jgi:hypothetical protein
MLVTSVFVQVCTWYAPCLFQRFAPLLANAQDIEERIAAEIEGVAITDVMANPYFVPG